MTITESIECVESVLEGKKKMEAVKTLKYPVHIACSKNFFEALEGALTALIAMRDIKEAESIEYVAEILKEYTSEVEV